MQNRVSNVKKDHRLNSLVHAIGFLMCFIIIMWYWDIKPMNENIKFNQEKAELVGSFYSYEMTMSTIIFLNQQIRDAKVSAEKKALVQQLTVEKSRLQEQSNMMQKQLQQMLQRDDTDLLTSQRIYMFITWKKSHELAAIHSMDFKAWDTHYWKLETDIMKGINKRESYDY